MKRYIQRLPIQKFDIVIDISDPSIYIYRERERENIKIDI